MRTLKSQLAVEQPSAGECWIPPIKDTPCPRAKVKSQHNGRRDVIAFRIKPHNHQRHSGGTDKTCAHQQGFCDPAGASSVHWATGAARAFQKMPTAASVPAWVTADCGKLFKRGKCQTTCLPSWPVCRYLEPDLKQWTGSKLGKQYLKAVYCHPAYLTSMQSISWERSTGRSTSWNQDCREKYQ